MSTVQFSETFLSATMNFAFVREAAKDAAQFLKHNGKILLGKVLATLRIVNISVGLPAPSPDPSTA